MSSLCKSCNKTKTIEEFGYKQKCGVETNEMYKKCIKCRIEQNKWAQTDEAKQKRKEYDQQHAKRVKEKIKEWRDKNKEHTQSYSKFYYQKHKEERCQKAKEYVENNKAEIYNNGQLIE